MIAKLWIANGLTNLVMGVLLFAAAGIWAWPAAWTFIFLFFGLSQWLGMWLARHDPALLAERMKPPVQRGQPLWDKIFLLSLSALWVGWLVLMGLDRRYGWSAMPVLLQAAGAAGMVLGYGIMIRVFRENTFLAPVVKIQEGRGHCVVSTGPYAVVRHPMYSGASILIPSMALLLGSWIGLAAAFAIVAGVACRAVLEERELGARLDGYADYAARVRWRLVPLIW